MAGGTRGAGAADRAVTPATAGWLTSAGLAAGLLAVAGAGCGPSVPADGGDAPLPECVVELDQMVAGEELPVVPGVEVRYTRNDPATPVAFDVDGTAIDGDSRLWDFSEGPDDVGATFAIRDPADTPHGDRFPDATYAAPLLVESPGLLGYFRRGVDDDGAVSSLTLLGVAPDDGVPAAAATSYVYDDPPVLHRYPLAVGDGYAQTAGYRSAITSGIPNQGHERWTFGVDSAGSARLPGGVEVDDVVRLHVTLEQTLAVAVGAHTRTVEQYLWVRPCFGEIARVVDADGDLAEVDELRRYDP